MTNINIKTDYNPELYRNGLPYRLGGAGFPLKSVLKAYTVGTTVVGWRTQEDRYRMAIQDDPGWLMFVLGNHTLNNAKHVAANIMARYHEEGKKTAWIKTIDSFKVRRDVDLYVLDTLFEDDTTYRRAQFYDALMSIDSPLTSAILLGRASDPAKYLGYIGLKPHLLLNIK